MNIDQKIILKKNLKKLIQTGCVATNDYIEAKVREIKLDNLGIK
jgi:hypothetical protein